MRECEDIPTRISPCCESALAHKKEFSIFKFPERFLEISCRDLTTFALFILLTTLIIKRPDYLHPLDLAISISNAQAMILTPPP
jgi:hypothetical protein